MESSNSSDYQERRVGPTVSKDKWINHARLKLSKGYMLVVGKNKRNANFYLRSKGFEMCPFNVAKQLIKDGWVVEAGEHPLGTMYRLADNAAPVEVKRKPTPRVVEPRAEEAPAVVDLEKVEEEEEDEVLDDEEETEGEVDEIEEDDEEEDLEEI